MRRDDMKRPGSVRRPDDGVRTGTEEPRVRPARRARVVGLAAGAALITTLLPAGIAGGTNLSDFSVTPATGGSAIPASTAGAAWTTLTGPVISIVPYSNPDVIPPNALVFQMQLPPNFEWNPAVTTAPAVSVAPGSPAGFCTLAATSITYWSTPGQVPIYSHAQFGLSGTHDVGCQLTFDGLQVRPLSGDASAGTGGNIAVTWTLEGVESAAQNGGAVSMAIPAALSLTITSPTMNNNAIIWGQSYIDIKTSGAAGTAFQIQASTDNVTFVPLKKSTGEVLTFTIPASGTYSYRYTPIRNYWYKSVADSTASNLVRITVRETCAIRPSHTGYASVAPGTSVTFSATVRPARSDLPKANVVFQVYTSVGGSWVLYKSVTKVIDDAGVASLAWTFATKGSWYVRAQAQPTSVNSNSFWTPNQYYTVG